MAGNPADPSEHSNLVVLARLLLGYLLVLPLAAPLVTRAIGHAQDYVLLVSLASSVDGSLQVFYDPGGGYSQLHATAVPLHVSDRPVDYRLRVPPGTYRSLRIDPGVHAGRYLIERVAILRPDGSLHTSIPLAALHTVQQLSVTERSETRLALEAPAGSNDPVLTYSFPSPLTLTLDRQTLVALLTELVAMWLGGSILVSLAARAARPLRPHCSRLLHRGGGFGRAHPRTAVLVAALLATMLATYPVLFDERSFASPNNGGMTMLYDSPPFVPGSEDHGVEDTRGTDVGAMMAQSVPHSQAQRNALALGEFPLWNRYNAIGRPLLGQGLTYIFDPLHWLTMLGPDRAPGWDLKFVAHRFVFAVGTGLAVLVAVGAWLPAVIVTAAAPFAGIYAFRFNHPAVFSITYAPWVLLAWFLLARAWTRADHARAAILLALSSSLLLVASQPKESIVALSGMELIGAIAVLLSRGGWQQRGRRLATAAIAGLALVLLTAPHWLIFLDTLRASATAYDVPHVIFAGVPQAVALFLSPLPPGVPQPGLHLLGLVLAGAAVVAPIHLFRSRNGLACALGVVALLAVAFPMLPARWLLETPLIGQITHVGDVFATAALAPLLIVCGIGAGALLTTNLLRAAVVTMLTAVSCWWMWQAVSGVATLVEFEPWALLLVAPVAVLLPACMLAARSRSILATGATIAAGVALLLPGGLHFSTGITAIDRVLLQPRPRVHLNQRSPVIDAIHRAMNAPTRTAGLGLVLLPGTQVLYGLEGIGGADPLEVRAFRELIDAAAMKRPWYWLALFDAADVPRVAPVLDMLNVGFLVARSDNIPAGSVPLPMQGLDSLRALVRPTAWPRAFFTDGVATYTDAADLLQQVSARRGPFAAILPTDARAVEATQALPASATVAVPAEGYELTANSTRFTVRAPAAGVAVLGETYLPDDFVATLNGRPTPYFRVNHVFKAVPIPAAGDWEVRFEYRPSHWGLALAAAGSGVLILTMLGLAVRRPAYRV